MPRISKPYFNLHQIVTGKYTSGNEFVLQDGTIYIGSYHILPTGQFFTESQPEPKSVEIYEMRLFPNDDMLKYNRLTGREVNRYVPPISYYPQPTLEDYKKTKIERFFVQKRTSPLNTILEIDNQQYSQINTQNNPGINGVIWNKVRLEWRISKIPIQDVEYLNDQEIKKNLVTFPYLDLVLTNKSEFYR